MKSKFYLLLFAILLISCKGNVSTVHQLQETQSKEAQKIQNLKAFAKVYGYVKYFHPSDEASAIDWNRFSAYGANEILKATDKHELIVRLNNLFKPIAPSITLSEARDKFDLSSITPKNISDYKSVYWQHVGVSKDMDMQGDPYMSLRVNRSNERPNSSEFGSLSTTLDAEDYRGKEIKFTAWVKLKEATKTEGQLWFRVNNNDGSTGFFKNMQDNPILSTEWEKYKITGKIDDLAANITFGGLIIGKGNLLIDDVHLYYKENEEWIEIPIKNNGFEVDSSIDEQTENSNWRGRTSPNYSYTVSTTDKKVGKQSALIAYEEVEEEIGIDRLFDFHPKFGELIEKEIIQGIFCQIPLHLYATDDYTFPISTNFKKWKDELDSFDIDSHITSVYLGNIINLYNVFQHFYPYFSVINIDWDKEFEIALERSLNDLTDADHLLSLEKFTANLQDGHISVYIANVDNLNYVPPIKWEWIEDKLVITKVKDKTLGIQIADVVTRINNQSSEDYFKEIHSRISASTKGWLDYKANELSLLGKKDEKLLLKINDKEFLLHHNEEFDFYDIDIAIQKHDYKLLENHIYYLNLSTIDGNAITELLPELQKAKGIICDLRGYPNNNVNFITHLLKKDDTSKAWMKIPKICYPDQERIIGYEESGWGIPAQEPYLGNKKIVFLTDGRAISYAESYLSFIEGYNLATIVGQPTAGTNGNMNPFILLKDFYISWTGMEVIKHDGSQHHGVGILPDIYVNKTIEGLKAGKDEFLEKAIEFILSSEN